MSLLVWLPLDGDLHNQGVLNPSISAITPSYTAGKIGQCYKGTDLTITTNNNFGKIWSLCFWGYVIGNSITSNWTLIARLNDNNSNLRIEVCPSSYSNGIYCYSTHNNSSNIITNGSIASPSGGYYDKWAHFCLTSDGTTITKYMNGIKIGTSNYTGSGYINGTFFFANNDKIYKNDIRIYNHCLSAAEVHEIAMGLVLHYKLDDPYIEGTTNLIPNPYANSYSTYSPAWDATKHPNAISVTGWAPGYNSGVSSPSTGYHAMWNLIDNIPTIVFQNHNSEINLSGRWLGVSSNSLPYNFTAGTKYTLSWEQKSIDTLGGYTTGGRYYKTTSSGGNGFHDGCPKIGQNTKLNKWEQFSYTFTVSNAVDGTGTNGTIYIYGMYGTESTMLVRNIQLEIKDHATPYTPNSRESNNIIQDSSGYGHNGTIVGNTSINSSTPRFQNSFKLLADGITNYQYSGAAYIVSEFGLTTPKQMTIAFWAYPENGYGGSANHASFCTTSSTYPTDYNTTAFNHRDGSFDINYSSTASNAIRLTFPYSLGAWNHYAITYDGQTAKAYKNGVLTNSTAFSSAHDLMSFTKIFIGLSAAGGAYRKTIGSYSDFRIYCTPLLDNDIKMLYNVGMKVDNLQNLHTFEYKENTSNLFRSELIMPWAKANRTRIGEIVSHNNTYALNIAPEPFYKNISDSISGALDGMFIQNTSYIFDMWVDTDSVIYNNNNVAGGMIIHYSDNSTDNTFVFTGGNKGYQHKVLITPSNKTIQRLEFYYYTSTDVFYRIDSCICPLSNLKLYKTGIFEGTNLLEETNTKLIKNALIETNQLIEI